jgi:GNAT superfamily N-acetyltransferase
MTFREYDSARDRDAVKRIWREVGWLAGDKDEPLDLSIEAGRALVAELDGEAECLVLTSPGVVRYLDEDLRFACVTGVTTSHIARKQGFPKRLIAAALASDVVEQGALVAGLSMFEQGFYNQLGFGSGGYEHRVSFDPSRLRVGAGARTPRRIAASDWEMAHAARLARRKGHGACDITSAQLTRAEMMDDDKGFGLGYCDGTGGGLTHYFWCSATSMGSGPYSIKWLVFRTRQQFLELMALVKSLGDQVRLVEMREPPGIQLQDLIEEPLKHWSVSRNSGFEGSMRSEAYWQMRICDLPGCMARTHLRCDDLRLNLILSDPIERHLAPEARWRGIGGEYVITLGASCRAEPGADPSLPTLTATVPSFTRLWLGVRPATGLATTDDLAGPEGLLEQLDWAFLLPAPKPDWDF